MIEVGTLPVAAEAQPSLGSRRDARLTTWPVYFFAVVCAAIVCASVWPGFMSFDSLETLRQARFGVTTNGYPTIVVYLQRIFDAILPGPGLLFVFQVSLYVLSCAAILNSLRAPKWLSLPVIGFLTFSPAILGPLLVVWKDIGMTAFLCLAVASTLRMHGDRRGIWLSVAVAALFVATAYRLNAVTATVPILAWCLFSYFPDRKRAGFALLLTVIAVGAGVSLLNKYRLPDLKPLDSHIEAILYTFDLVGITARSGELVIPAAFTEQYESYSLDDAKSIYFPSHGGRSWVNDPNLPPNKILSQSVIGGLQSAGFVQTKTGKFTVADLKSAWWHAICAHPKAYIKHRYDAVRAFLGIGAPQPWYLSHPLVTPNDLGVVQTPTPMTGAILGWLDWSQRLPIGFPWFYYVSGLAAGVFVAVRKPPNTVLAVVLLVSAFALLLPMLLITASAEQRYHLWSMVAIVLATASLICPKSNTRESEVS